MKVALVNPSWSYRHSIYFGCQEPHLPIEFGCTRSGLEAAGHEVLLLDGQLMEQDNAALAQAVRCFRPDMTVVTTAPTYLFWRCAPPELRVPAEFLDALDGDGGREIVVGPHASATPGPTLRKLGCDLAVRGECEGVVAELAEAEEPYSVAGTAWLAGDEVRVNGPQAAAAFVGQPALRWPASWIGRHDHHHHRFDEGVQGPGAEVEASRGCPYNCSFCAKIDYRDAYRRRALEPLLEEIDGLIDQGVTYLYFIDEIFLPLKPLLEALVARPVVLQKKCRMSTDALADRLVTARRNVPFVQANLIATAGDDPALVARWRDRLQAENVWANDPVPLYPYPSSPAYRALWGLPDDYAWERAHDFYLKQFDHFSDLQDQEPLPLPELERGLAGCRHG